MKTTTQIIKDIKKEKVKNLLVSLEKINPKEISNNDGLMDFKKVDNHPKIKEVFEKLNKMNVSRKYLLQHFNIAGLTLGHLLNLTEEDLEKKQQ